MYDVHLRLIEKHVMDLLLMLLTVFHQVLRLKRYERISIIDRCFRSNRVSLAQNFK